MQKPRYHVQRTFLLHAPADTVWSELRDYSQLVKVFLRNRVEDVRWLEGGSANHVPARLGFIFQPGDVPVREDVVGRTEIDRSITFRTVGQALSFETYVGTVRITPLTGDATRCVCDWSMEFSLVEGADPGAFLPMYESLVDRQIGNLEGHFGGA